MAGLKMGEWWAAVLVVASAAQYPAVGQNIPDCITNAAIVSALQGKDEMRGSFDSALRAPLRMTASLDAGDKGKATAADASKTETRMTKDQAKELFKSVDEILAFASKNSKLPIEHSVKRTLISRDEVNKFLRQRFEQDESTKRLERSEIVLKKFGLLDRDFHLQTFLVSLLTEQIAGYYDDKTKTVNLLDWIAPDEQKSVLAHEHDTRAAGPEGGPCEVGRGRSQGHRENKC